MANKWIEHVRKWSAEHGVSYMCATSMPACKEAYNKGKAPKNTQKANREQMGAEDVRSAKKEAELLKESKESSSMGMEDRDVGPKKKIKPRGPPAGPPPLTAEQVAEVKRANKASQMARLRAQRKEQGLSNTGKTFVRPKDSPSPRELEQMGVEDIKSALLRRAQGIVQPLQSADREVVKPKGRPKKYATAEEAKRMKSVKTVEARRAKKAKAKETEGAGLQEVTDDELFRTMAQGGAHAEDNQVDNYSMIINHLVEHISDPSEPVDPRDYDQAIHFIREMRRAKGGAELYSKEYYGGMMPAGAPPPRSDAGRRVFHTPGLLEIVEQFLRPAGAVPEDIRRAIIEGRNVPRLHGGTYTPVDSGNQFLDVIAHTGHQLGQEHPASKFGLNPFDMGEKLGEKLGNAMMKTKWGNPHTGIFSKSFWTPKKHRH
jgi:hypothetical protein